LKLFQPRQPPISPFSERAQEWLQANCSSFIGPKLSIFKPAGLHHVGIVLRYTSPEADWRVKSRPADHLGRAATIINFTTHLGVLVVTSSIGTDCPSLNLHLHLITNKPTLYRASTTDYGGRQRSECWEII